MATLATQVPPEWIAAPKRMLFGGEWVEAASRETLVSIDPSDGSTLAEVPSGGPADVDAAVACARAAFEAPSWAHMTPDARSVVLWRLADLVEAHAEELALLDTLDGGKPLATARRIDLPFTARLLRYWAGWPARIEGASVRLSLPIAHHAFTSREPLGVVGVIAPWNAPSMFVAWKAAAALACGNTVVFKPAEETSLSALRIAELALEAGLPPGALNVVTGFGERAGAALAAHPDVDKVAFTGSVETGRSVVAGALGNLKRVSLELGGKSANVVCADADLDAAIAGAAHAIFFNQGCVCAAGARLYVQEPVYEAVLEGVVRAAEAIRVGPARDLGTRMGPLISGAQRERVAGLVSAALDGGARALTGARAADGAGFFYEPTVLVDAAGARVAREEVFGPVLVVERFGDLDEAIALANDSEYGLAAGIWSRDVAVAHRFAQAARAGTVWVNAFHLVDAALPFGGFGQSGWGRDLGREAIDLYTETKAVCMRLG
jgi:phenylacetaldehyde dehydrogenase